MWGTKFCTTFNLFSNMIKSFFIVLLCFNCAFAQNDSLVFAFISGKCTDTIWKEQTLRRFDLLLQDDIIFDKTKINLDDSSFTFKVLLSRSFPAQISNSRVFISPGDTISLITDGSHIYKVSGKYSGNYLFHYLLKQKNLRFIRPTSKHENNWREFKEEVQTLRQNKIAVLDSLHSISLTSGEFYLFSKREIAYSYYAQLLSVILSKKAPKTDILTEEDVVEIEQLVLLKATSDIDIKSLFFQEFAANYLKWKFNHIENKDDKLTQGLDFIKSNYSSTCVESLMCYWFFDYYSTYLVIDNPSHFDSLYSSNSVFFKRYEFRERMQEIYSKIHGIEISIPIDVQLTELLSKRINRTTLGKIIGDNNRYQYCVFDFWASWCQPCIKDRLNSAPTKNFLKSKNIKIISISVDHSSKNWERALEKYKWEEDEYLLLDSLSLLLSKYQIQSFPRYILIDPTKRHIISLNTPRISSLDSWKEFIFYLEKKTKFIK